ncbi:MAG: ribosome recycling factor [Alphaproteobacteria bacterium]|nr:ribosome recycling factor [Alphaproteobacteria bacterium]
MSAEYLQSMGDDFKKVIAGFEKELTTVRTGRATPQLLDSVSVHVASYGSAMPLNQLGSISAPDARMLVINPWDKGTIPDIEKGIIGSGLGLNPSNDGQIVRVPIPALTGERRQELVRAVKKMAEDARIRARHVRREYNDLFKELETEKEISQDDLDRFLKKIQESTDGCVTRIDELSAAKEQEVLEV